MADSEKDKFYEHYQQITFGFPNLSQLTENELKDVLEPVYNNRDLAQISIISLYILTFSSNIHYIFVYFNI